ncbi:MAG: hypothetical protein WC966_01950 [Bradymonadales bacterium]
MTGARYATAQSLGFGLGLGFPLMSYITNDVGREYRVTPSPGYYPLLRERVDALGSAHFHVDLLLDMDIIPYFEQLEIRFDAARFLWKESRTTHVSCEAVELYQNQFDDSATRYIALGKVTPDCLDRKNYSAKRDISGDQLPSLWFFHISVGMRYHFLNRHGWRIFVGPHIGFTIGTLFGDESYFGGSVDAILGLSYELSELVSVEFTSKLLFLLSQAPENRQSRINHESQTGGNILTSIVQPFAYFDFQLGIRLNLGAF